MLTAFDSVPARDRVIVALDCDAWEAIALADKLEGHAKWLKIGMTLYYAEGPAIVKMFKRRGFNVFLDLKFHDIPHQVQGAARSAAASGADMLTMHTVGGTAMMEAGQRGAEEGAAERCGHVFFPGCQLAGARGEQVLAVYETLRKDLGSVGLLLQCCGVPAQWAGEEKLFAETVEALKSTWESLGRPRVIAACASCCKTLREALPEVSVVSLWEVLDTECPSLSFREEACCGGVPTLSIHDPCSARHDEAWLRSVRSLLSKRGVPFEEPRLSGETTPCCGYGGLTWDANPQLASAIAADRAGQLEHDAVTSCIMCRERLVAEGKPSLHMLDLLYPGESLHAAATAKGSGLSARRAGRAALRTEVLRRYAGESVAETVDDGIPVRIAPDVLEKMEERHILREDAVRVVRHAEASGDTFLNRDNGHFLASLRPVRVTFWVEYSVEDGVCVVHDAYCHRMEVPGTSTPKGRYEAVRNPFHL